MRCNIVRCRTKAVDRGLCHDHHVTVYGVPTEDVEEWEGDPREVAKQVEECARPLFIACMFRIMRQGLERSLG